MKKMKITIIMIIVLILMVGGIFGINYLNRVKKYQDKVANTKINDIDISKKENGEYFGEYDVDLVAAKVKVNIKDGKIDDIELINHKTDKGKKAEKIIDTVVEKNSLKVDTVSGATNSSKVILKAIEKALEE